MWALFMCGTDTEISFQADRLMAYLREEADKAVKKTGEEKRQKKEKGDWEKEVWYEIKRYFNSYQE